MKMIKMALFAVLAFASVSAAQGGGGGGGGGGRQGGGRGGVAALLTGVSDSAAVFTKATEIFAKYQADTVMAGLRGGRGTPVDTASARYKAAVALRIKRNDEIKALLTKEADKKKFDENFTASLAAGRRGGN
jgi:hypothetical protein